MASPIPTPWVRRITIIIMSHFEAHFPWLTTEVSHYKLYAPLIRRYVWDHDIYRKIYYAFWDLKNSLFNMSRAINHVEVLRRLENVLQSLKKSSDQQMILQTEFIKVIKDLLEFIVPKNDIPSLFEPMPRVPIPVEPTPLAKIRNMVLHIMTRFDQRTQSWDWIPNNYHLYRQDIRTHVWDDVTIDKMVAAFGSLKVKLTSRTYDHYEIAEHFQLILNDLKYASSLAYKESILQTIFVPAFIQMLRFVLTDEMYEAFKNRKIRDYPDPIPRPSHKRTHRCDCQICDECVERMNMYNRYRCQNTVGLCMLPSDRCNNCQTLKRMKV